MRRGKGMVRTKELGLSKKIARRRGERAGGPAKDSIFVIVQSSHHCPNEPL